MKLDEKLKDFDKYVEMYGQRFKVTFHTPAPKLCIDCKHLFDGQCQHENNIEMELVYGRMLPKAKPRILREDQTLCGSEGRWYEPKFE